jgi:hypothetical protein
MFPLRWFMFFAFHLYTACTTGFLTIGHTISGTIYAA